jgi:hypothetical protein
MTITVRASDIVQAIKTLEIEQSVIALNSSLRSFGYLEGAPDTLIDAFLAADCNKVYLVLAGVDLTTATRCILGRSEPSGG